MEYRYQFKTQEIYSKEVYEKNKNSNENSQDDKNKKTRKFAELAEMYFQLGGQIKKLEKTKRTYRYKYL